MFTFTGAVGGDDQTDEDKEKAEEEERERLEAIREAEERRKEKHRKMEEEREKMRQEIRDKVSHKNPPFCVGERTLMKHEFPQLIFLRFFSLSPATTSFLSLSFFLQLSLPCSQRDTETVRDKMRAATLRRVSF